MKNAKYFISSLFIVQSISSYSFAEIKCNSSDFSQKDSYQYPGDGYWMQTDGKCNLTFTSVGGTNSQLYDLCQRKVLPLTNYVDAFPIPDTDLYVHSHPIRFYSFTEVANAADEITKENEVKNKKVSLRKISRKTKRNVDALLTDAKAADYYQSVGVLEKNENEMKVRIAVGYQNGAFRDYTITNYKQIIKSEADRDKIKINMSSPFVLPCSNIRGGGLDSQLPMLSRDGKYIAAREGSGGGSMGVYEILEDASCKKISSIPNATSKVSFGFGEKNIYYVVKDESNNKGRLVEFNFETKKTTYLTSQFEDVKYATTTPEGDVLYTRQGESENLVRFSKAQLNETKNSGSLIGDLGNLYAKKCKFQSELSKDYALAEGYRISQETCFELVNDPSVKNSFNDDEKKNFSSACASKMKKVVTSAATSNGTNQSNK